MPIDWFTVVAEAINFLILVWLLKRFLYKPILNAIDEREKGIAAQLATAQANQAESQKVRDDFQHKNETFDQERAALMTKAAEEAKVERQRQFDDARNAADIFRVQRQKALQSEQNNLSQEISRWTQNEVFAITRKTLADLATASLEERMTEVFIDRLRTLDGTSKERLVAAAKTSNEPSRVRTAFDLPQPQRTAIECAVKETFAMGTQVQFETVPALIAGIELVMNGQKVAWSIADYLSKLEKSAGELLCGNSPSESEQDIETKKPGVGLISPSLPRLLQERLSER